jgi:hypothetical protein
MAKLSFPGNFIRAKKTEAAIDAAIASDNGNLFRKLLLKHLPRIADAYRQDDETDQFRSHLGASLIGRKCERELWLGWRWTFKRAFPPRILRLFNRGHQEEARFLAMLEMIGVQLHQPEDGGQERISDHGGHFGSALDGVLWGVPECPDEWILGEFKTHGTKPFCDLVVHGVQMSKPEHYAQMQTCMARRGIFKTLYLAVNKNDDDVFAQIVTYQQLAADKLLLKAKDVITRRDAPKRIANDPSHFDCTYCNARTRCHYPEKEPVPKNCRTCRFSVADLGGTWGCEKHNAVLHKSTQLIGCDDWDPMRELVKR